MDEVNNTITMFHAFYSEAFSQLISITVALIVLVGAIMPTVLALFQKRKLAQEREFLQKYIQNEIETTKLVLQKTVKSHLALESKALSKSITELESIINKKLEAVDAGVYHIQGNNYLDANNYPDALESFIFAANKYLDGNDELNLLSMLESIEEYCLPKVSKKNHTDEPKIEKDLMKLINLLENSINNSNGRYQAIISKIQAQLKQSIIRE